MSSGPATQIDPVLIRRVRLVPIGGRPTARAEPVDLRIRAGRIEVVAPAVAPEPGDVLLEADGRWAIPGLWDAHVHLGQWALAATQLDLAGTSSPAAVTALVADHLAGLPPESPATVVLGGGYRSATWSEQPTVAELDAVSGQHLVVLNSGDNHNGWLNSAALRRLGVDPVPAGALDEADWFMVLTRLGELPGADPDKGAYARVVADAAAKGLVGVVDLELAAGYRDWPHRIAEGVDRLRVRAAVYPDRLEEVIRAGWRTGQALPGGAGLVTMGPLKIISDGSLNTRTAYCYEPYPGAAASPGSRGKQTYPPAALQALLDRAHRAGLEAAVHAIGDAAVTDALDAFAATGATGSIEHVQLMRLDDLPRMGRLGVRASVQPAHLLDDRDVTAQLWPDRAERCFPLRSLLRAGVPLVLGSDAPVAPLDPWLAMAAAVHRSGDERPPWNPAEALTPAEALAASVDGQPTLAPGSPGDVALLDADPLAAGDSAEQAARLRTMRVAATLVAGRLTYRAPVVAV